MILPDFTVPSRVNQTWRYSGSDDPEHCLNPDHFMQYPHDIEYSYNSRGYRDAEWPAGIDQVMWCVGDSFTVGIGSPWAHTWPQRLQTALNTRTINVSMDGGSNEWIARKSCDILKKIQPSVLIIHWSYLHRRDRLNDFWQQFYNNVCDTTWPNCHTVHDIAQLPMHIQQEILPLWSAPSDEDLVMHHGRTTHEQDLENFVACVQQVTECAGSARIVHSTIPEFVAADHVAHCINELASRVELTVPYFDRLDWARDFHHYDIKTADHFVNQIQKLL